GWGAGCCAAAGAPTTPKRLSRTASRCTSTRPCPCSSTTRAGNGCSLSTARSPPKRSTRTSSRAWRSSTASRRGRSQPRNLVPAKAEGPVQHLGGGVGAGRGAAGGAAENVTDQGQPPARGLEQQAVQGRGGVPGLDAVGARIGPDQVVRVLPPVVGMPGALWDLVD